MPDKITPFLWFDDNAEQAVKFYTSIFKNSKVLSTSRYTDGTPGKRGSVMTIDFTLNGQRFVALNGGPVFKFNESISFVVYCDSQKEIDTYWRKLTSGGGKPVECGWLRDKYGVSWQIVPRTIAKLISAKHPAKATRVMQQVMKMVKLDMKKLQRAYAEG